MDGRRHPASVAAAGRRARASATSYLKKLTIKPREHWPQWVVTRIAPNEDGIMHATLSLIGDEATTRRMSTAVLDDQEDWELLQKAESYSQPGGEA